MSGPAAHSFRAVAWTLPDKHGTRSWDVFWVMPDGKPRAQCYRTTEQSLRDLMPGLVVEIPRELQTKGFP